MSDPQTRTAAPAGTGSGGEIETRDGFGIGSYGTIELLATPPGAVEEIQALAEGVERELDGDRRFFRNRPRRSYRVRRGFPLEVREMRLRGGLPPISDRQIFVAVRQIRPGLRARLFFGALGPVDLGLPESTSRQAFEALLTRGGASLVERIGKATVAEQAE